jgi:hypothetical protein
MIKFKKIHERQKIMNNNSSMLRADSIKKKQDVERDDTNKRTDTFISVF